MGILTTRLQYRNIFLIDCTIATSIVQDQPFYNHFIKFTNRNSASLKLSIQLWNLADFKNATLKLGFFALPVPLSGSHLKEMNTGIELYISQKQIGFVTTPSEVCKTFNVHFRKKKKKRKDINFTKSRIIYRFR